MRQQICWWLLLAAPLAMGGQKKAPPPSALDQYIAQSEALAATALPTTPGAVWSPSSRLADGARDLRASQVDDIVTVLVEERASASATGTTKSARTSSAKSSVTALAGVTRAAGPLANLATLSGDQQLSGQGTTSRETVLTTTLTARVTRVLPNGNLVLEGSKDLQVNSEHQAITVRGVIRPADLTPGNVVRSDRLAQLELRVNGKGVVGDAVRRPFILYRLLLGLLPF
jgi:flagellar L-ring protein precursor FlgH